jgi:hypothetical protein
MLDRNGWAVNYLGADTPMSELTRTAREISPDLVVLAAVTGEHYHGPAAALTRLTAVAPVALGGPERPKPWRSLRGAVCSPGIRLPRPRQ